MLRMPPVLQPTYVGFIRNAFDAALLFEACMQCQLPRLHCQLPRFGQGMDAKSGHIFAIEEHGPSIKRRADRICWSRSRVLDAFILCRELDGQQMGAGKRRRLIPLEEQARSHLEPAGSYLYGSLIDSYPFKSNCLMKKTISVRIEGQCWRLVSYYTEDVMREDVWSPSQDPGLCSVPPILGIRQALPSQDDLNDAAVGLSRLAYRQRWSMA